MNQEEECEVQFMRQLSTINSASLVMLCFVSDALLKKEMARFIEERYHLCFVSDALLRKDAVRLAMSPPVRCSNVTWTVLQVECVRLCLFGLISRSGQALHLPRPSVDLCVVFFKSGVSFGVRTALLCASQGQHGGKGIQVSVFVDVCACVKKGKLVGIKPYLAGLTPMF